MTGAVEEAPQILLRHHLKKLKLPTVLREHEKLASAPPRMSQWRANGASDIGE